MVRCRCCRKERIATKMMFPRACSGKDDSADGVVLEPVQLSWSTDVLVLERDAVQSAQVSRHRTDVVLACIARISEIPFRFGNVMCEGISNLVRERNPLLGLGGDGVRKLKPLFFTATIQGDCGPRLAETWSRLPLAESAAVFERLFTPEDLIASVRTRDRLQ
jgi:hypothetical protein